jgi:peroxiredoxin
MLCSPRLGPRSLGHAAPDGLVDHPQGASVNTSTATLRLGDPAPSFMLPAVDDGRLVSSDDVDAEVQVVVFLCRHCPYVVHVQQALARVADELQATGRVAFVGISANDPGTHPDDAPERLAEQRREVGFSFPYLFDASQDVARAFGAVCTPDPFVFDAERRLAYRGRLDDTRPGGEPATCAELRAAVHALLAGERPSEDQWPPMGCSIKWRPDVGS